MEINNLNNINIWLLLYIFYCVSINTITSDNVVLVINAMDNCHKNQATLPMVFVNQSVVNLGRGRTVINGVLVADDNAGPLTLVKVQFYKCKTRQITECEYFLTVSYSDTCKWLASDVDIWTPFLNSSTPRLSCEAKKGNYVFKNGYLDFTRASQRAVFLQNYWRMRIEFYNKQRVVFCIYLDFEMLTLINRKNRRN